MNFIDKALSDSKQLNSSALDALHKGELELAESTYRAAIDKITTLLDPIHLLYVDMLKGLHTSLTKQNKFDEAGSTSLLIAQLCLGQ